MDLFNVCACNIISRVQIFNALQYHVIENLVWDHGCPYSEKETKEVEIKDHGLIFEVLVLCRKDIPFLILLSQKLLFPLLFI